MHGMVKKGVGEDFMILIIEIQMDVWQLNSRDLEMIKYRNIKIHFNLLWMIKSAEIMEIGNWLKEINFSLFIEISI